MNADAAPLIPPEIDIRDRDTARVKEGGGSHHAPYETNDLAEAGRRAAVPIASIPCRHDIELRRDPWLREDAFARC
jgi:hypothetical protein